MAAEVTPDSALPIISIGRRVAQNASIYFISQLISWVIAFISISIVPRTLGERTMGELLLAGLTISNVSTLFALSLESYLIREIGRDVTQTERLVRATLGLRLALMPLLIVASLLALRSIHAPPRVLAYGLITLLGTMLNLLADPLRSVLAGWERAKDVAFSDLIGCGAPLLAIPFLIYGAWSLIISGCVATATVLLLRICWLHGHARLRPTLDLPAYRQLVRGGMPFLVNNYVAVLYSSIGVFVIRHYTDDSVVGQLGQVGKLVGTFMFVPAVVNSALLPVLARAAQGDPATFKLAQLRILTVLMTAAMPVTAGVILLAHPLCDLLYKPHQYSLLPAGLQYSALAILPLYIVTTIYQFLVAQGRNSLWTGILVATALLCGLLQWLLIPLSITHLHNALIGCNLGWAIAEAISACAAFVVLGTNPLNCGLLSRLFRGLIATLMMSLVMWHVREWAPQLPFSPLGQKLAALILPAIAGCTVFAALTLLLRVLPPQEQTLVLETINRKLKRRH